MPKAKMQNQAQTADDARAIQKLPLTALYLHPINPRQEVTDEEIEALAQSIRVVGLIQNLAGIADQDGRVGIVAGGRRLRALEMNAKQDKADLETILVPVKLAENDLEAQAWANAENVAREALNPAAEVRAYAKMAESGAPTASIAKAFAVTVRHVAGRLKLAHIAPEILGALGNGEITLDLAAAFTVNDDHAAQLDTFKSVTRWHDPSPSDVRRMLTEESTRSTDRLACFVGRARYEAAGGAVREDLFGDDVWFEDQKTLLECAQEQLDRIAKEQIDKGFKWAETTIEYPDYRMFDKFGRTYPEQEELTDEEGEQHESLADLIETNTADDEQQVAFETLEAKLQREIWSDQQKQHSGVIVSIDYRGETRIERGIVRPEDLEEAAKAGVCKAPAKWATTPKEKGPYSAALVSDLAAIRTGAVQTAMLEKPQLALDLLTFVLTYSDYNTTSTVGLRQDRGDNDPGEKGGYQIDERLNARRVGKWSNAEGCAKAFLTFLEQGRKQKNALLAEAVAKAISGSLAKGKKKDGDAFFETIAQLCDADVRAVWTPTEGFFKRLTGQQLDAIMADIKDEAVTDAFVKMKKKDKAAYLHQIFGEESVREKLDQAMLARIDAWTPEGMEIAVQTKATSARAA